MLLCVFITLVLALLRISIAWLTENRTEKRPFQKKLLLKWDSVVNHTRIPRRSIPGISLKSCDVFTENDGFRTKVDGFCTNPDGFSTKVDGFVACFFQLQGRGEAARAVIQQNP